MVCITYDYGALYLCTVTSASLITKILLMNVLKSTDNSLVTLIPLNSNPGLGGNGLLSGRKWK